MEQYGPKETSINRLDEPLYIFRAIELHHEKFDGALGYIRYLRLATPQYNEKTLDELDQAIYTSVQSELSTIKWVLFKKTVGVEGTGGNSGKSLETESVWLHGKLLQWETEPETCKRMTVGFCAIMDLYVFANPIEFETPPICPLSITLRRISPDHGRLLPAFFTYSLRLKVEERKFSNLILTTYRMVQ